MFKRTTYVDISFNQYRVDDDVLVEKHEKSYYVPTEYDSKEEAYERHGNIEEWAKRAGRYKTIEIISSYDGFDFPDDWETVDEMRSGTYYVTDIESDVYGYKESEIRPPIIEIPVEIPIKIPVNLFKIEPYGGFAAAYSPGLQRWINKEIMYDINACSRPVWHLYGMDLPDCHIRLRKHGINAADTDILIREFKRNTLIHISDAERNDIKRNINNMIMNKYNYDLLIKYHDDIVMALSNIGISQSDIDDLMESV